MKIQFAFTAIFLVASAALGYNCADSCEDQATDSNFLGEYVNPVRYAACQAWRAANCFDIPGNITDPVCSTVGEIGASAYSEAAGQMNSRSNGLFTRGLNNDEKEILRPVFGDLVDSVQVTFGALLMSQIGRGQYQINLAGSAQAYGYRIYLDYSEERSHDNLPLHTKFLGHELVHVQQYRDRGNSENRMGRDYFTGWCQAGFSYTNNHMERAGRAVEDDVSTRANAFYDGSGRKNIHAITCLQNDTDLTVYYQAKWGNAAFANYSIPPHQISAHWYHYRYINQNSAPVFTVSFDSDYAEGFQGKQYSIQTFAGEHSDCTRIREKELFTAINNGQQLELYQFR